MPAWPNFPGRHATDYGASAPQVEKPTLPNKSGRTLLVNDLIIQLFSWRGYMIAQAHFRLPDKAIDSALNDIKPYLEIVLCE